MKTLQELHDEFLREKQITNNFSPITCENHRVTLGLLLKFFPAITVNDITYALMLDFLEFLKKRPRLVGKGFTRKGIKTSTLATHYGRLDTFLKWMIAREYLAENPLKDIKYPVPEYDDRRALDQSELGKYLVLWSTI